MDRLWSRAGVLPSIVLVAGLAFAQDEATPEAMAQHEKDVVEALLKIQNPMTPFDYITSSISYPVVVLDGFATHSSIKRDAETAVRGVPWVTHVVNRILDIPGDPATNQLRQETLSILRKAVPQAISQNKATIRIKIYEMKVTLVGSVAPDDVKRLEAAVVRIRQLPLVEDVDNQVKVRERAE